MAQGCGGAGLGESAQTCSVAGAAEVGSSPRPSEPGSPESRAAIPGAHTPHVSSREEASVTGPQALFSCPSISRLPLPARKFNFQRPLCTSGARRL